LYCLFLSVCSGQSLNERKVWVKYKNLASIWYICWVMSGAWGPSTSRIEQPHMQERRHTLTQNLEAMGLWVLLLIRCLTFTLLSDVGHITHTCRQQHPPSSVSPSIHHAPLQAEALTCLYRRCWFLRNRPTLYRRCCFLRKRTSCLGRTLCRTGLWYHCLVTEGEPGGPTTTWLEQPHKQERRHTLNQNLKAMGLWVFLLIRCSTFTLLSDVGHITYTCTQFQHSHINLKPYEYPATGTNEHLLIIHSATCLLHPPKTTC